MFSKEKKSMIVKATGEEIERIQEKFPDARIRKTEDGTYRIRGIARERLAEVMGVNDEDIEDEPEMKKEDVKVKMSSGNVFGDLMGQAAAALMQDIETLKQDAKKETEALVAGVQAQADQAVSDMKTRMAEAQKKMTDMIDETKAAVEKKLAAIDETIQKRFTENDSRMADYEAAANLRIAKVEGKLTKVGEALK